MNFCEDEIFKYRDVTDHFQNRLSDDLRRIKLSLNMLIFADKTRNINERHQHLYHQLLTNSITRSYKQSEDKDVDEMDHGKSEKRLQSPLPLETKFKQWPNNRRALPTKRSQGKFRKFPNCRLINAAKIELCKIGKVILNKMNDANRSSNCVNRWTRVYHPQSVDGITDTKRHTFLFIDIVDFLSSVIDL